MSSRPYLLRSLFSRMLILDSKDVASVPVPCTSVQYHHQLAWFYKAQLIAQQDLRVSLELLQRTRLFFLRVILFYQTQEQVSLVLFCHVMNVKVY